MKIFKKIPLVSIILGLLIIIYAVLSRFINNEIFNLTDKLGLILIGISLLMFTLLVVLEPLFSKKTKGLASFVILVQGLLLIYGSISAFLLKAFNVDVPEIPYLNTGSQWFALALVSYGSINIILETFNKLNRRKSLVYANLAFIIGGVLVYERNLVNKHLEWISFASLLLLGLYFLIVGLLNKKGK